MYKKPPKYYVYRCLLYTVKYTKIFSFYMHLKCSGGDDNTSVVLNHFSCVGTSGASLGLGYFGMQAGAVKDQPTNLPASRWLALPPNPQQAPEAVAVYVMDDLSKVQKKIYCSSLLIDPVH